MPKVKISEYSATANSNTDVASINIDEGCAPSGINNAIRAVMGHLKDFQQGTNGDPFNGPHNGTVGATTPSTGAFTTVSASGIVTSTATAGQVVKAESGTTGILYSNFANTGGTFLYGIDNSAGTALFSGSAAYAGFIGTSGARPLVLATNGAGRAFIDSSGNVGIGETNPASPLQITSSIAPTSGSILRIDGTATTTYSGTGYVGGQIRINFTNATSRYAGINFSNTGATSQDFFGAVQNASGYNDFVWQGFSGSYLERMRLDSSGNLGLGVTPNAWGGTNNSKGLQVGRAGAVSYSSDDARVALSANAFGSASNGWNFINNGGAAYYSISDFDNNHRWFVATTTSGTAGNAITFTQAMTLDASGNLIVGGTSPTGRLTVADGTSSVLTLRATTAVDADGRVIGTINFQEPEGTGDGTLAIEAAISGLRSGTDSFNSGGRLAFYTRPFNGTLTQAMTLDASGNLLVGTTSSNGKLSVEKNAGGINSVYAAQDTAGGYCYVSYAISNGGTYYHMRFLEAGTQRGSITSNGTLTTYATTSDYRLKNVIGSITGHGERIDALKPVDYQWKDGNVPARGFLAHEFQEVYADSVIGTKDALDANGNPMYQGMQAGSSEVIADLVAEIQSLRKRLAAAGI